MLLPGNSCHTPRARPPLSSTAFTRFRPCIVDRFDAGELLKISSPIADPRRHISSGTDVRIITSRGAESRLISVITRGIFNKLYDSNKSTPYGSESVSRMHSAFFKAQIGSPPYIIHCHPLKSMERLSRTIPSYSTS